MDILCEVCGGRANTLHEFCFIHNWCDPCWETTGRHLYQFNCVLGVALITLDRLGETIAYVRETLGADAKYNWSPLDPKAAIHWSE